ncbi:hypothetical protein EMPG_11979 [Blastomyces silverae]|uniref:Uncharacterized protein n=1 Tax=Blastomyces silverae TaxID=2060906 RepID=A0A0H1BPU4_9EURO|nr:hypothetical protein EMPG_11979 [Blastomyces silverae]
MRRKSGRASHLNYVIPMCLPRSLFQAHQRDAEEDMALKVVSACNPANGDHILEQQIFWSDDLSAIPLLQLHACLYGLTVFCDNSGAIVGFRTDFRSKSNPKDVSHYCLGDQASFPLHFRLSPDEIVTVIWRYGKLGSYVRAPGMVILTTHGRGMIFGPALRAHQTLWTKIACVLDGIILGLFYTETKVIRGNQMTEFGALWAEPFPITAHLGSWPIFKPVLPIDIGALTSDNGPHLTFMNYGNLNKVGRIVACYQDSHCCGLHYQSSITDILGRWYGSDKDKHITIFSGGGSGNELKALRFSLSGAEPDSIVHDVKALTPNDDDSGDNAKNRIILDIPSDSRFAWWFTGEADMIRIIRNSALW